MEGIFYYWPLRKAGRERKFIVKHSKLNGIQCEEKMKEEECALAYIL